MPSLLGELRTFVALASPTDALFRTNHASNHLPLGGRALPAWALWARLPLQAVLIAWAWWYTRRDRAR